MNSITLVAAPSELNSPFFLENKRICEAWKNFIKKNQGTVKGKCSAWALIVKGEIEGKNNWFFRIKKSTSSTSSIFISSEKSIIEFLTIEAASLDLKCTSFSIRKPKWFDFIRLKLDSNYKRLNANLVLKANKVDDVENYWLVELIERLPVSAKVDVVKYNHLEKTLILRFQSILEDFDFVERLISGEY